MAVDSRRLVKVFLASPGDLAPERKLAKEVVDEFNNVHGDYFNCHVDLVGWEDTVSVFGRPQSTINRELERCELFIGLMWKKWGTPPGDGEFTSGFEEEFRSTVERRQQTGKPEISLFFKEVDKEAIRDPGEQLKKVLLFREELIRDKTLLFEAFLNLADLQKKLSRCIARYVHAVSRLHNDEGDEPKRAAVVQDDASPSSSEAGHVVFSEEALRFLRGLLIDHHPPDLRTLSAVDAARFRLLGAGIGEAGNDRAALGAHDANLIYQHRGQLSLSAREQVSLLEAGLRAAANENVPLWTWASLVQQRDPMWLFYATVAGEADERSAALTVFRYLRLELVQGEIPRRAWIDLWLKDAPAVVRIAALRYLGALGEECDIDAVRVEFEKADGATVGAAAEALVRIKLRDGRHAALKALFDLRPTQLPQSLVDEIFSGNGAVCSNEDLLEGLDHPSAYVRRASAVAAAARSGFAPSTFKKLLDDSDAQIRMLAVEALASLGEPMDLEAVKAVVVKPSAVKRTLLGMGPSGEDWFEDYRKKHLRSIPVADLEAIAATEDIFSQDARLALAERSFDRFAQDLRSSVDDGFEDAFARDFDVFKAKVGMFEDLVAKTLDLKDFLKEKFLRQAIDVLCKVGGPEDLARIRGALVAGRIPLSVLHLRYLSRYGDWSDIALLTKRAGGGGLGYLLDFDGFDRRLARTIYALGRNRVKDLLTLEMPGRLKSLVITEVAEKSFAATDDALLFQLMNSDTEIIRKTVALRCVAALPKRRVTALLDEYVSSGEHRYYNVVHWLDLGISFSRDVSVGVAKMALADSLGGD